MEKMLKLSLDAIAGFMLALQKAVSENIDMTDLLESMEFVEKDGFLYVTNLEEFKLDLTSLLTEPEGFEFLDEDKNDDS